MGFEVLIMGGAADSADVRREGDSTLTITYRIDRNDPATQGGYISKLRKDGT